MTVWKRWIPDDGVPARKLYMDGLHKVYGIYRIGVAPETAPLTWDDIKALSGMPAVDAGPPSARSPKRGANLKEWRGSFDPVSRDHWLAVEKFDGFNWKDCAL